MIILLAVDNISIVMQTVSTLHFFVSFAIKKLIPNINNPVTTSKYLFSKITECKHADIISAIIITAIYNNAQIRRLSFIFVSFKN